MAERSMEKPDIVIQEWPCSLYIEKKKRWVYGLLAVKSTCVLFNTDNTQKDQYSITVPFSDFTEVKKAKTGLVFGAIIISTCSKKKFWISSLDDREGAFASLQHFWRSLLIDFSEEKQRMQGNRTDMGQALLGIVHDSEKTLSLAGVQLHAQGRQIDNALGTMHELHSDLDVADHLVEDLQAWVGRWKLPQEYTHIDPVFINKSEVPDIFEFEVLYTKLEPGKANNAQNLGLLRLSKDGLTILTPKQSCVQRYRWPNVSKLRVVTPWELIVVKFEIGKPDLTFTIVCANMVAILKLLEKCAIKYKLQYDTPPDTVLCHRHENQHCSPSKNTISAATSGKTTTTGSAGRNNDGPVSSTASAQQSQVNQSKQIVSESEAEELSQALTGLKSLALSVQEEELVQNEKLDRLKTTVERANDRLKKTEQKISRIS